MCALKSVGAGSMHSRFVWADDRRQLAACKSVLAPGIVLDVQWSHVLYSLFRFVHCVLCRDWFVVTQILCDDWHGWAVQVPAAPAVRRILVCIQFKSTVVLVTFQKTLKYLWAILLCPNLRFSVAKGPRHPPQAPKRDKPQPPPVLTAYPPVTSPVKRSR